MAENNPTSTSKVASAVAPEAPSKNIDSATLNVSEAPRSINSDNLNQAEQKQQNIAPNADTVGANPINEPVHEQSSAGTSRKRPLNIHEINADILQGKAITVEEQKFKQAYDANQNQNETATVKQKKDNSVAPRDVKPEEFKEDDVIQYMWNHWIIDGALWADEKIRKYALWGYDRTRLASQERREKNQANLESDTYKESNSISDLRKQKEKEIEEKHKNNRKEITDITTAIKDGTLNLPENKNLLKRYEELVRADTSEGKAKKELVLKACDDLQYKKGLTTPEGKIEFQKARAASAKVSGNFYAEAIANERFDYRIDHSANNLAAATMLDGIARNKDMYPELEPSYKKIMATKKEEITKATLKDREKVISSAPKYILSDLQDIPSTGEFTAMETAWSYYSLGNIEKIQTLSDKAFHRAKKNINKGRTSEMDAPLRGNIPLKKLNEQINGGITGHQTQKLPSQSRAEIAHESAQDTVKDLQRQDPDTGKPMTLKTAAEAQAQQDANSGRALADIQAKKEQLNERDVAHQEIGTTLHARPIMAKYYGEQKQTSQQTVDTPSKNNFITPQNKGRE